MVKDKQKLVGEFFGLHHGMMQGWRGSADPVYNIIKILQEFGIPSSQITKDYIENMRFLEAGGSGNKARGMVRAGCKNVYYIDLSEENTNFIRNEAENNEYSINVINGSILDSYPEFNDKFDLIHCGGVIHHTANPALALLNMKNWLKNDGFLFINCYQSGTLYFFWIYLIREILSLVNFNYNELHDALIKEDTEFAKLLFSKYHFLDHALVPIINPTTENIFKNDLKQLGLSIISSEKGYGDICHDRYKMEMVFKAQKKKNINTDLTDLLYNTGIDQLSLDYNDNIKSLIKLFYEFKKVIGRQNNVNQSVIRSVNKINKIWVNTRCWEINFKTFNKYGIRYTLTSALKGIIFRLRSFIKHPILISWTIFQKPEKYFYHCIYIYLLSHKKYVHD